MARGDKQKLQKEYDDIILNLDKFNQRVEQANRILDYYNNNGGNPSEISRAQRQVNQARAEQYANEQASQQRLIDLQSDRRINQRGYVVNNNSTVSPAATEIRNEQLGNVSNSQKAKNNFTASIAGKGGGNMVVGALNVVSDLVSGVADIAIAEKKKTLSSEMERQDIYAKTLETGNKIFKRHMDTFAKGMQGALSSSFSSITQGVQEGAYAAASSSLDLGSEMLKNQMQDRMDRFLLENYRKIRHAQGEKERLDLTAQQVNTGANMVSGVTSMFGPVVGAFGSLVSGIASTTTKILQANAEIELMRLQKELEIKEKELENITNIKEQAVDTAKQAVSSVLEFSKAIENVSVKTDAAAKAMANVIGMSGNYVDNFEDFIFNATRNLSFKDGNGNTIYMNKNAEDLQKMQTQYIESTGRNREMTQSEFVKSFELGKVLGDDNLAVSLMGDMDYFNKSISNSRDLIFDMFQQANKAGVSNRKFAKDLQQNLKLAEKYTFKGGVKSMMQMSIWAQKTRFNMDNLEGILNKIQDGGLEGVITQGAKLQVLGGNMAMGADPLAMMYESWADPEALAKRFSDMTKGIGQFNSKTGEVDIVGADAMRLKQYAEATGIDYKDARAQITQRIKGEQIDRQLDKQYSDEQKALLYNKAKLGEDGKWKVNVLDKATNQMVEKDVNDLQESDWNSLMPTEESIENYVGKIYNLLEKQEGVTNFTQAVVSDETFENLKNEINERMTENVNWVTDSSGKLKKMIEESNKFATEQNAEQHKLMNATTSILNSEFEIMKKSSEKIRLSFTTSGSELVMALDAVKAELDAQLAEIKFGEDSDEAKKAREKADSANSNIAKKTLELANDVKAGEHNIDKDMYDNAVKMFEWMQDESNTSNINDAFGMLLSQYENGETDIEKYEKALSEGYDDLMDALANTVSGMKDNIQSFHRMGPDIIDALVKVAADKGESVLEENLLKRMKAQAERVTVGVKDGLTPSTGKSLYHPASQVIPIHDGPVKFAKTDPSDSALFAKVGGPFDTMVNGVFNRVDSLYNTMKDIKQGYPMFSPINTLNKMMSMNMENNKFMKKYDITKQWEKANTLMPTSNNVNNNVSNVNNKPISFETLKIEINGKLEVSSNGKSVDIINELNDNPIFLRNLSRMLTLQITNAINGGRGLTNLAVGSV